MKRFVSKSMAVALGLALAIAASGCSISDEEELSPVDEAPPRLLDDGAGQRYFEANPALERPRGTMIVIHAGGWRSHGPATFAAGRPIVRELTRSGFRVVAISVDESPRFERPGAPASGRPVLDDLLAFHDQVRVAFPDEPVCAFGVSGGGHLALLLAIERPGLACASGAGPPTDLPTLVGEADLGNDPDRTCTEPGDGVQLGACHALATWGGSRKQLRRASPALRWSDALETSVWAGFELEDPIVPASQRRALSRAVEDATVEVLRPDPDGEPFAHSTVRPADRQRAVRSWLDWLDEVVPPVEGSASLPDGDLTEGEHEACNSRLEPGPSWRSARRRDRADLLTAPGRWRPEVSTASLVATNSCNGREHGQQAGLTAWVPGFGTGEEELVNAGDSAAWIFEAPEGSTATAMTASFRGFIANAGTWRIGLYTRQIDAGKWSAVVECDGVSCDGLQTQATGGGVTVVPEGTGSGADDRDQLPEQTWSLPNGSQEVKWQIECVARRGCLPRSINPGQNPFAPNPRRPIDPSGRPAVLSLYELSVETGES